MSRPPYPHPSESTGGEQTGDLDHLEYLPLQYADLLALQQDLAVTRLGRPRTPDGGRGRRGRRRAGRSWSCRRSSGILLVRLPAPPRRARPSSARRRRRAASSATRIGSPTTPTRASPRADTSSLVTKELVSGTVAAGLPLASVPLGEIKAQDYETRDDLAVDAALNELVPLGAHAGRWRSRRPRELRSQGVGHGLAGRRYRRARRAAVARASSSRRRSRMPGGRTTTVRLDRTVGVAIDVAASDPPPALLAHPALACGRSARMPTRRCSRPPRSRPRPGRSRRRSRGTGTPSSAPTGRATTPPTSICRSRSLDPLANEYVLRSTGNGFAVLQVTAEVVAAVTINREVEESFTTQTVTLTPTADGGFTSTLTPDTGSETVAATSPAPSPRSGSLTRPGRRSRGPTQPVPAEWLADWARRGGACRKRAESDSSRRAAGACPACCLRSLPDGRSSSATAPRRWRRSSRSAAPRWTTGRV